MQRHCHAPAPWLYRTLPPPRSRAQFVWRPGDSGGHSCGDVGMTVSECAKLQAFLPPPCLSFSCFLSGAACCGGERPASQSPKARTYPDFIPRKGPPCAAWRPRLGGRISVKSAALSRRTQRGSAAKRLWGTGTYTIPCQKNFSQKRGLVPMPCPTQPRASPQKADRPWGQTFGAARAFGGWAFGGWACAGYGRPFTAILHSGAQRAP